MICWVSTQYIQREPVGTCRSTLHDTPLLIKNKIATTFPFDIYTTSLPFVLYMSLLASSSPLMILLTVSSVRNRFGYGTFAEPVLKFSHIVLRQIIGSCLLRPSCINIWTCRRLTAASNFAELSQWCLSSNIHLHDLTLITFTGGATEDYGGVLKKRYINTLCDLSYSSSMRLVEHRVFVRLDYQFEPKLAI